MAFFAAGSTDIGWLVWALSSTMAYLFAVAAGSCEWALDALVGAVGLVMTRNCQHWIPTNETLLQSNTFKLWWTC